MNELRIDAFAQRLGKALDSTISKPTNPTGLHSALLARCRMDEVIKRLATEMAAGVHSPSLQNDGAWIEVNLHKPYVAMWRELHTQGDAEAKRLAEKYGISPHRLIESAGYWTTEDRAAYARAVANELRENAARARKEEAAPVPTQTTPAATTKPVTTEAPKRRRGRPEGAKNKPKVAPLPVLTVTQWDGVVSALRDIVWRKPGMTAQDIVACLDMTCGRTDIALARLDDQAAPWIEKRRCGSTKEGKPLHRYYPRDERSGWFFGNHLWPENQLAAMAPVSRIALRKRLQSGWTVEDAISKSAANDGRGGGKK